VARQSSFSVIKFDYLKRENVDFIKPDMWPPNNQWIMLFVVLFSNESITDKNLTR